MRFNSISEFLEWRDSQLPPEKLARERANREYLAEKLVQWADSEIAKNKDREDAESP